jgi:hypothetical protein
VVEDGEESGEDGEDTVTRLIDSHDNEYILTKPHAGVSQMELIEDFALISDLVQVLFPFPPLKDGKRILRHPTSKRNAALNLIVY